MSQNSEPVRIHLYVDTGLANASHEDDIEIPRNEWNAMTPAERRDLLDDNAEILMSNHIEYGWQIEDEDDHAATEDPR